MTPLAALIITYNEEDNIKECLESIKWIEEIVIVDSYSSDSTLEICRNYTDEIYQKEFIDISSQRNYGLEQIEADWVLVIDADERVTADLKKEIKQVLANNTEVEGYFIPRKNYFLGKWIKYCGWYPDYTLRLFQTKYRFKGKVHEKVNIDNSTSRLKNDFIHYTYKNLEQYINKINNFTTISAAEMYQKGRKVNPFYVGLRTFFEFFKKYILQKGILLGPQGLLLSILSSYYKFLKYAKLWEKHNNS
ncbi:MAG: glycosyltransferase family 2 protein [Minisyncoccales bacterium]